MAVGDRAVGVRAGERGRIAARLQRVGEDHLVFGDRSAAEIEAADQRVALRDGHRASAVVRHGGGGLERQKRLLDVDGERARLALQGLPVNDGGANDVEGEIVRLLRRAAEDAGGGFKRQPVGQHAADGPGVSIAPAACHQCGRIGLANLAVRERGRRDDGGSGAGRANGHGLVADIGLVTPIRPAEQELDAVNALGDVGDGQADDAAIVVGPAVVGRRSLVEKIVAGAFLVIDAQKAERSAGRHVLALGRAGGDAEDHAPVAFQRQRVGEVAPVAPTEKEKVSLCQAVIIVPGQRRRRQKRREHEKRQNKAQKPFSFPVHHLEFLPCIISDTIIIAHVMRFVNSLSKKAGSCESGARALISYPSKWPSQIPRCALCWRCAAARRACGCP